MTPGLWRRQLQQWLEDSRRIFCFWSFMLWSFMAVRAPDLNTTRDVCVTSIVL